MALRQSAIRPRQALSQPTQLWAVLSDQEQSGHPGARQMLDSQSRSSAHLCADHCCRMPKNIHTHARTKSGRGPCGGYPRAQHLPDPPGESHLRSQVRQKGVYAHSNRESASAQYTRNQIQSGSRTVDRVSRIGITHQPLFVLAAALLSTKTRARHSQWSRPQGAGDGQLRDSVHGSSNTQAGFRFSPRRRVRRSLASY